jgi:hypothetical protein
MIKNSVLKSDPSLSLTLLRKLAEDRDVRIKEKAEKLVHIEQSRMNKE